jgi:TolB protein
VTALTLRAAALAAVLLVAGSTAAEDRMRVDVIEGSGRDLQIAVQRFAAPAGSPSSRPAEFDTALTNALALSGFVGLVSRGAFLEPVDAGDYASKPVACDNWKGIGADGLVQGRFEVAGERVRVHYRVWDTVLCRANGNEAWEEGPVTSLPWMARRVADEIVRRFTGRQGIAATQIAFVSDRSGNKEIYLMESDGSGKRGVTSNRSINLFPSWSPKGDMIVYTSYRSGPPDLWLISRGASRPGRLLASAPQKYRGVWHPNDGQVAVVMNQNANTDIFLVGQGGKSVRRITYGASIETSPTWSPDGRRLAFVSDQTGSPQIYVRELESGETRRLTYRGDYNASPAWSPTGEWIAFAAQTDNSFDIYLIDPDTGYTHPVVVHPRSDETPAWAPDGRTLAFVSNRYGRKEVFSVDITGGSLRRLTADFGNSRNPAWSPRLQ